MATQGGGAAPDRAHAVEHHVAVELDRGRGHQRDARIEPHHDVDRFAVGEMVGNAWSEVGSTAIDTQRTTLRRLEVGDHRLDVAAQQTGLDLTDPDTAARWWLLLRSRGLA